MTNTTANYVDYIEKRHPYAVVIMEYSPKHEDGHRDLVTVTEVGKFKDENTARGFLDYYRNQPHIQTMIHTDGDNEYTYMVTVISEGQIRHFMEN